MAAKLKKGDKVVVLAGRDKGREGVIERVIPAQGRAIVGGVNTVIRHQRQSAQGEGGRYPRAAAVQLSNLALVDPEQGGPTRVGFKVSDAGKKVRFAKKSGAVIDE
jgi:large subunit ribosomal protein L24